MGVFIASDGWMPQWTTFGTIEIAPSTLNFSIKTDYNNLLGILIQFRIEEILNG